MYLNNLENFKCKNNTKKQTLYKSYNFWLNWLFDFCIKLFSWENIDFPQKEIETRLILFGRCGFNKVDGVYIPVDVGMYGLTNFYDEYSDYTWTTPLHNGKCIIGKDGLIINNSQLRTPTYHLIEHYALLLAHTEISLINALVNGRSSNTIIANTDQVAQSARQFYDKLYNGQLDAIVDKTFESIDIKSSDTTSINAIKNLYDTLNNILTLFYESIGVRKAGTKKERMVVDEVNSDSGLLKLNILDMFNERRTACKNINKLFGLNITVNCNVDIDGDNEVEDMKEGVNNEPEGSL